MRSPPPRCPVYNRLEAVMLHIPAYWFDGLTRLAKDVRVARSTISRLLNGQSSPSFALVWAITKALGKRLGRRLDPCELISVDGTYPTPSVCALCGCRGCLPAEVYDAAGGRKPEYRHLRSGQWALIARTHPPDRQVVAQEAAGEATPPEYRR